MKQHKKHQPYDQAKLNRLKIAFKNPDVISRILDKYGNKTGSRIVIVGEAYSNRGRGIYYPPP